MNKLFLPLILITIFISGCGSTQPVLNNVDNISTTTEINKILNNESMTQSTTTKTSTKEEKLVDIYDKAIFKTSMGDITVEFYNSDSPNTVENFLKLAKDGFYTKTTFHRVIDSFMIQGGDPLSKEDNRQLHGTGGPGYKFADEFNDHKLVKGSLAMANAGPNTNGSQFFIVTAKDTPWLDKKHTNFGVVTKGMDIVEKIEKVSVDMRDNPIESIVINEIELIKK